MSYNNQPGNTNTTSDVTPFTATAKKSSAKSIIIAVIVTIAVLCGGVVGAHYAGWVDLPFLSGEADTIFDDNVSIKEQEINDISKPEIISSEISQEPVDIIELNDENSGYSLLMNTFNNERIALRLRTPDITNLSADSDEKFSFIYHIRFAKSIEDLKTNNPDIYGEIKIGPLYLGDPVPISEFGHLHENRHDREVRFENGEFIAYIFLSDENLKYWEACNVIMLYKEVEVEGWGTLFEGEPVIFYKDDVTRLSFTEILYPGKSTLFVTDLSPFKTSTVNMTYEITSSNTITATLHIENLYDVYILEKNRLFYQRFVIACDHDWVQNALAEEFGEWARGNPMFSFVGLYIAQFDIEFHNSHYYHEDLIVEEEMFFLTRGSTEAGWKTFKKLFTSIEYELDFDNNNIIFYIGTYVPATEFSNFTVEWYFGNGYTPGNPYQFTEVYIVGLIEHSQQDNLVYALGRAWY